MANNNIPKNHLIQGSLKQYKEPTIRIFHQNFGWISLKSTGFTAKEFMQAVETHQSDIICGSEINHDTKILRLENI